MHTSESGRESRLYRQCVNDKRDLYVVILKSIVNFIWEFQSAEKQMEICLVKKLVKRLFVK